MNISFCFWKSYSTENTNGEFINYNYLPICCRITRMLNSVNFAYGITYSI